MPCAPMGLERAVLVPLLPQTSSFAHSIIYPNRFSNLTGTSDWDLVQQVIACNMTQPLFQQKQARSEFFSQKAASYLGPSYTLSPPCMQHHVNPCAFEEGIRLTAWVPCLDKATTVSSPC